VTWQNFASKKNFFHVELWEGTCFACFTAKAIFTNKLKILKARLLMVLLSAAAPHLKVIERRKLSLTGNERIKSTKRPWKAMFFRKLSFFYHCLNNVT